MLRITVAAKAQDGLHVGKRAHMFSGTGSEFSAAGAASNKF